MRIFFCIIIVLTFFVPLLLGNNQSRGNFNEIALDVTGMDKEMPIYLSPKSMAIIKLEFFPSTGYRWELINPSGFKGIVREVFGSPNGAMQVEIEEHAKGEKLPPGSPHTQIIRLIGESQGIANVTLALRRSWGAGHLKLYRLKIHSLGKFSGHFSPRKAEDDSASRAAADEIYAPGLPAHWDWRDQGGVTPVRDQMNCNSCWAFGTIAATEAQLLIKDGVSKDLSEQFIIDCNDDGFSCNGGGWWGHDYHWFKVIPGISGAGVRYESEYPYTNTDTTCVDKTPHEQIEGWAYTDDVPDSAWPQIEHNVTTAQLKQKIYDYGPVATDICSSTWGTYTGGVFTNHCSPGTHIVLITGWDDYDGCFYIKNSWGTSWGENGYMRLAYNTCEVGHNSTYLLYGKTNPRIIYRASVFNEHKNNDGSINNNIELRIEDSTSSTRFSRSSGNFLQGSEFTVSNLPTNLSMNIQATSNTTAILSLSGSANFHANANDVSNLTIAFQNAAFSGNNAAAVENSTFSELNINFFDPYHVIHYAIPSTSSVNAANPWQFYYLEGSNYQYSFGLWWYDSVNEPDPNNNQTLKFETYSNPALSKGNTAPANLRALDYGAEIGPNQTYWAPGGSYGGQHTIAGPAHHDFKGGQHYAGFTFNYNGYPVYGWMKFYVYSDGSTMNLIEYAWQQDPNKTIMAGQVMSPPSLPVADFYGNPTTLIDSGTVNFTDNSTGNPTTWSWSFPGGSPSTSTSQNPTVTYSSVGTYSVTLTVTSYAGSDIITKNNYITVEPGSNPITYCASNGNDSSYEWIAGVQMGSLDNTTDASSGGYADYTSQSASLPPGSSVSVTLTPGFSSSTYTEYWKIWVDYNKNGSFTDSGENVFSGSGSSAVSGSFTVPSSAEGSTRVRVSMKYYSAPTSCESFTYGEVEDYMVDFSGSTPNPPTANFSASPTTIQEGASVYFYDESIDNPTSWSWSFPGGTPSSSTSQNPIITYNTEGTWDVTLTVSNAYGSDTLSKNGYITVTASAPPPVAEFSGNPTNFSVGEMVLFTDESLNNPTSWSWSFPGGIPSSSTSQNPTVIYPSIGTWDITLTVSNAYGSDTITKAGYINVTSAYSFCSSNGNSTNYEWIEQVQIHTFSNISGKSSNGYQDFRNQTIQLSPGLNTSVNLTPGFNSSSYNEFWMIWIDFNMDGNFDDPGENVFSGSGSSTVSGSFTVPSNASSTTYMRISMRYYTAPPPCGSFQYGEVEDYAVSF